jgi:hypothetical protein
LAITPLYTYTHKFQDHYDGHLGFNYRILKEETDFDAHSVEVRLSYSTVQLFIEKHFPLPLSISVRYTDKLASNNNRWKTQYLGVLVEAAF